MYDGKRGGRKEDRCACVAQAMRAAVVKSVREQGHYKAL